MNPSAFTPYHQLPITMVLKATRQKTYRQLHCSECGWPIGEITDKVVMLFDGETPIERLEPTRLGLIDLRCHRSNCKQYYRLEFAM